MLKLNVSKYGLIKWHSLIMVVLTFTGVMQAQANAFQAYKSVDYSYVSNHVKGRAVFEGFYSNERKDSNQTRLYQDLLVQNKRNSEYRLRSKSEVVREVKQRYNAEVLKISLNKQRATYQVRILLPNGRVKQISVNAKR
ncbi:MAG: hypothetical protein MK188_11890 [Gammaproteobacteria bacterium]|nr:hypothetical protein [Gammaproteobacteria bacterium]